MTPRRRDSLRADFVPAFELSWDDDAAETVVRTAPSHVRLKSVVPQSLPKLAPVLELPPELQRPASNRRPPPLPKRRARPTQPLPLFRRWSAATRALPLVHKLELHLRVRRVRARRAWIFLWAAAFMAAALGGAGLWMVRHSVVFSGGMLTLALQNRDAARSSFASLSIQGPEGARVKIDGTDHGTLPLSIEAIAPGRHAIVIDGRPTRGLLIREVELTGGEALELGELEL